MSADRFGQAESSQRLGPPLTAIRQELWTIVRQPLAHVMQKKVGIWADNLADQLRLGGIGRGGKARNVAALAAGFTEQSLALPHLRIIKVAPYWYA